MDRKKKLIRALADVVGFDLETEMYRSAGSFEKALHLFFQNVLRTLKAVNSITRKYKTTADVINLRKKTDIKNDISDYLKIVYKEIFTDLTQRYLEILDMYKKPKSLKTNSIFLKISNQYFEKLNKEILDINTKAQNLLALAEAYKITELASMANKIEKLRFISTLNYKKFLAILKSGDLDTLV